MNGGARSALRRWSASLSIIDAAVSSLGNFGLVWAGAQLLDIESFGEMSIIMTIGLIMQGVTKAAFVDAFTLGYSAEASHRQAHRSSAVLATTLSAGAVLAVVVGVASLIADATLGPLMVLALIAVPLVTQDTVRWTCYARQQRLTALVCTTVWTLVTAVGVLTLWVTGTFTASSATIVWGAAAGVAALGAMVWLKLLPRVPDVGSWLRESRRIGVQSTMDYGLTQAVGIGGGLLVAGVAGLVEFGLFRVAQLPLAAIQIAVMGSIAVLQPAMVRRVADGRSDRALDLARRAAVILAAVSVGVSAVAMVVPESLAIALFGDSWPAARHIVPALAVGMVASGIAATYGPYLRATGRLGLEVRFKLVITPVAAITIAGGSALAGGIGGAAGQSVATAVVAGCFVIAAHRTQARDLVSRQ